MKKVDVLVVGSGIAGLSFSIYLAQKRNDLQIVIYTKADVVETNTRYAQGGIAGVFNFDKDSFTSHINDTLEAGGFENNVYIVEKIIKSAPDRIQELEEWGVNFTTDKNGKKDSVLEGGHSFPRVVHSKDATGNEIETALIQKVKEYPNITIHNHYQVLELIKLSNKICGVSVLNTLTNEVVDVKTNIVVLSTGGCGQLFKHTTNPFIATGDGIFLAHNIGAKISGMNNIQFHPTAFYEENQSPLFLISEAVRGAGAYLINENGERFLFKFDRRGELATRDIVTKAILTELKKQNSPYVYLDCRHLNKIKFIDSFPMIYTYCENKGIDIEKMYIPVVPAAHYQCGGIEVNEFGETNIQDLYALGECSNTGMHGKNRLASNSLLEAIAFAFFAADDLAGKTFNSFENNLEEKISNFEISSNSNKEFLLRLQNIMYDFAMIGSNLDLVKRGLFEIKKLENDLAINDEIKFNYSDIYKQIIVSKIILKQMINEISKN